MKFHVVLVGVLFCLAAQAASKPNKAPLGNQSAPKAQHSLTGCIDEQAGQYVLLDDQMAKIASLQSADSDQEVFAKHLGRMVRVIGTDLSGRKGTFQVTRIEQLSGRCGQAK